MNLLTEKEIQKLRELAEALNRECSRIQTAILNGDGSSDELLKEVKMLSESIIRDPEKFLDEKGRSKSRIILIKAKLYNPDIIQLLNEVESILESK